MKSYAEKEQKSVVRVPEQQNAEETMQMADKQPQTGELAQLKEMVRNSPQTMQLKAMKELMRGGRGTAEVVQKKGDVQTLQAVWIKRGNQPIWVEPPYVPLPGDEPGTEYFTSTPSVVVGQGKKRVVYDATGNTSVEDEDSTKTPTHPALQETRKKQGQKMRERVKPSGIVQTTEEMKQLAERLERCVSEDFSSRNKSKTEALLGEKVDGDKFRELHDYMDELTQAQATASYYEGLRQPTGSTPPLEHQQLENYANAVLRTASALRIPTSSVVAPVKYDGKITGQQHPTKLDVPTLDNGRSSHAWSDRKRVLAQNKTTEQLSKDSKAPPNAVLAGGLLAAVVSTLSTMSHPLTAKNIPQEFLPGATEKEQQMADREKMKNQAVELANFLGVNVPTGEQEATDPFVARDTPTSPPRKRRRIGGATSK